MHPICCPHSWCSAYVKVVLAWSLISLITICHCRYPRPASGAVHIATRVVLVIVILMIASCGGIAFVWCIPRTLVGAWKALGGCCNAAKRVHPVDVAQVEIV